MNKGWDVEDVITGFVSTAWSILHISTGSREEKVALRLQSVYACSVTAQSHVQA